MSLGPGRRLGPYEVLGSLGAGGMGQVWRARDTRLGRDVALKLLPDNFAGSPERRSRLEQEARLLASLNHPSIAALHDVLDDEGSPVLVMEVVEGETLAERLSRGPLPFKAALALALPIAEALEAAHERGILHRDLKPSNVKLPPGGGVKLLDFGLAKALDPEEGEVASAAATLPKPVERTESGVAVGTAPYMSPEQARGERVDKRTDVWAFGCILFEMLTGRRAFPGASRSDSIAAVLTQEPDWASLPPDTPSNLQRLLKRCLQKDQKERLRDIADVRLELKDLLVAVIPSAAVLPRRRWLVTAVATLVFAGLGAFALWFLRPTAPGPVTRVPRFQVSLPRDVYLAGFPLTSPFAISPREDRIVFLGCGGGRCQLYVRDPSDIDARPLPGTDDAECPFFSPDGRLIAFGAGGKLKKIDVEHGTVVALADARRLRGGSWGEDGSILFSTGSGGLLRVSAEGGDVREVTKLDAERSEYDHRWPQLLPGSQTALVEVLGEHAMNHSGSSFHDVAVVDLETGQKRILVEGAGFPKYASGHVLFGRDGIVYSAPLDIDRLQLEGPPVPVLEGVLMWSSPGDTGSFSGAAYYDITRDGTLLFSPREARLPRRSLLLLDRNGDGRPLSRLQQAYSRVHFSPDGRRLAVGIETDVGTRGAFVVERTSDSWTRAGSEGDLLPVAWMPDGNRLLLSGRWSEDRGLFLTHLDGSAAPQMLHVGDAATGTVAPDGSAVLFVQEPAAGQYDIWRLALDGPREVGPWLATPNGETWPRFSPDARWVVYRSDDSGQSEIYVRSVSGSGARRQVSTQHGEWPRWGRDEIFFVSQGSLWSSRVRTSTPSFDCDPPRKLFELPEEIHRGWDFYDVSSDGQHFVMVEKDPFELRPVELVIVPSWVEEMKARVAAAK